MPREKLFERNHRPAFEGTQAVLIRETCRHTHRVQVHNEKRDSLDRGELALFPVDPKPQLAEVLEHQVPVIAQLLSRPDQNEPVFEIVEDPDAHFPSRGKDPLRDLREDTRGQGEPEGEKVCVEERSRHKSKHPSG